MLLIDVKLIRNIPRSIVISSNSPSTIYSRAVKEYGEISGKFIVGSNIVTVKQLQLADSNNSEMTWKFAMGEFFQLYRQAFIIKEK